MKKQVIFGILVIISLVVIVGATRHFLYDNFSDGFLNKEKWEIRQDPEGQPFTDEYGVEFEDGSFVFHIEQMSIGSHRTFLVPRYKLKPGDSIEYDYNLVSRTGHYGNTVLLVGEEYGRIHLVEAGYNNGVQNYDELGVSHVKIIFTGTSFDAKWISPSGKKFQSSLPVRYPDGNYELYIGSWSGHNGNVHTDYDNFWINGRFRQ